MICKRKVLLELILDKKPEIEEIILREIDEGTGKIYRSGNATCCYLCDGKNKKCIDYKLEEEIL